MAATYGQFCTVARALEVLGERWTLLIVREVMAGGHRFEQIRRGVPKISRTMLSQRLRTLIDAGVLVKEPLEAGGHVYRLTPAGHELVPVVQLVGSWGRRWLMPEPTPEQLDPDFLLHDMQRSIPPSRFGRTHVLFRFEFDDLPRERDVHYLFVEHGESVLCPMNPGFDVDLEVQCGLDVLTRVWLGDLDPVRAQRGGLLRLAGDPELVRRFGEWFGGGYFLADVKQAS